MDRKKFGERIKYYLSLNNMSIEDFSAQLGLAPAYVKLICSGNKNTSLSTILKMSKIFGVTVDELIEPQYHDIKLEAAPKVKFLNDETKMCNDLARKLMALHKNDFDTVENLISYFLKRDKKNKNE